MGVTCAWAATLPLAGQIQLPSLEWAYSSGADTACNGNAVCTDAAGNGYVVSFFRGQIDADPGPGTWLLNAATGGTAMVQKVSPSGHLIWARQYGGTGRTGTNAIEVDGLGNLYIVGAYDSLTDFDPGPGLALHTAAGGWDAYVLKLDTAGNFLWVATAGSSTGHEWAFALDVDGGGNAYVTGMLGGAVDFDPGGGMHVLTATGIRSAFAWKLGPNGSLGWARQVDGAGMAMGRGIAVDTGGHAYVCGRYSGTMDFDPGAGVFPLTAAGNDDGFLLKLDAGGNLLWAQGYGSDSSDVVENVCLGPWGKVYLTGHFQDSVDFDPSPSGTHWLHFDLSKSAFVSQLDSNGSFRWAVNIPQSSIAYGKVSAVDAQGGIYVQGYCWGNLDFDPSPTGQFLASAGPSSEGFVLKLDSSGGFAWVGLIAGLGTENFHALALDPSAGLWMTGNVPELTDVDPGSGNFSLGPPQGQYFLAKWNPCTPPMLSITDTLCSSYATHGHSFNQDGDYLVRIPGPAPCDSLLELHLTFTYQQTHIYRPFCFPDTLNAQVYTHPGTYIQVMQSVSQCDSVLVYHLTGNPYYRYLVPVIACGHYTHRNVTHYGSGTFYYALPGPSTTCDTVEVLQLTLHHNSFTLLNLASCTPITLNDSVYSSTGTYTQVLTNADGCDSVLSIAFTLLTPTTGSLTDTACNSYPLNGQAYTASGVYTQQLTNVAGCDSTLTLHLTLQSSHLHLYQDACDSFSLNGISYHASGHYTQHFTNGLGCDSILHIHLTLHGPTSQYLQVSSCGSYTLNSHTYQSSGTYQQHLTNAAGCDSILTLFLTVWPATSAFIVAAACDSFSLNGSTYHASGVYTQSLVNAQGCDSILNLYLTVDTLNLDITQSGNHLVAQQSGGSYQWLRCDSLPVPLPGATGQSLYVPSNGYYAVVVRYLSCQDTSACVYMGTVGLGAEDGKGMVVYPNPNDGGFWVEVAAEDRGHEVVVSDALGHVVSRSIAPSTRVRITLPGIPAGIYCLHVGGRRCRVVVQR